MPWLLGSKSGGGIMNEREFAKKITREINRTPVSASAAARLRAAREAAVAHAATQTAPEWAGIHNVLIRFWHRHHAASIGLLLILMLVLGGSGWQWQKAREADQALEAQLLADELPMDLFLTGRF